jgi:nitrile hydratase beta subunit-like protein
MERRGQPPRADRAYLVRTVEARALTPPEQMSEPKRKTVQRKGAGGRAVHDVGGLAAGPIDREEHDLALWEKRTDAMLILLRDNKRRILSVDSHRRTIEDYSQQAYDRTTYYEKWIRSIRNLLVEQEVLTREEIEARMAKVRARHEKAGRTISKGKVPW